MPSDELKQVKCPHCQRVNTEVSVGSKVRQICPGCGLRYTGEMGQVEFVVHTQTKPKKNTRRLSVSPPSMIG